MKKRMALLLAGVMLLTGCARQQAGANETTAVPTAPGTAQPSREPVVVSDVERETAPDGTEYVTSLTETTYPDGTVTVESKSEICYTDGAVYCESQRSTYHVDGTKTVEIRTTRTGADGTLTVLEEQRMEYDANGQLVEG